MARSQRDHARLTPLRESPTHGTQSRTVARHVHRARVVRRDEFSLRERGIEGHPAQPNEDLAKFRGKGVKLYVIQEDLEERGIDRGSCVAHAQPIRRTEIVDLLEQHDQVWHW